MSETQVQEQPATEVPADLPAVLEISAEEARESVDIVEDLETNTKLNRTRSKKNSKNKARRNSNADGTPRRLSITIYPCDRCGLDIVPTKANRRISSDDGLQHWHMECFRCQQCNNSLYICGYFFHEDGMYCDECMDQRVGKLCGKCGLLIKVYSKDEDQISTADGKNHWHAKCMKHLAECRRS